MKANINDFCEMGSTYSTCCAVRKDGTTFDTTNIHKVGVVVIYEGEEYHTCSQCARCHFGYDDYREDTVVYDAKSGKDITIEFDFG